jgi:hypothetical protein
LDYCSSLLAGIFVSPFVLNIATEVAFSSKSHTF